MKIRGYRIELGEIEAALEEQPEVAQAVVLARAASTGAGKRLAGYVVLRAALGVAELQGRLKERLPHYMVPATLQVLERMPLSPNGKIDRRALPEPVPDGAEAGTYRSPVSEAEKLVAQIWAECWEWSGGGRR